MARPDLGISRKALVSDIYSSSLSILDPECHALALVTTERALAGLVVREDAGEPHMARATPSGRAHEAGGHASGFVVEQGQERFAVQLELSHGIFLREGAGNDRPG